jgi:hypothetical protein
MPGFNLLDSVKARERFNAGPKKPTLESKMQNQLEELAMQERYTGFMPDKALLEEDLMNSLEGIKAELPYAEEAFNADLASRGMYSAGEAPKYMYKDVVAPVARAMTSAVSSSKLAYAGQYQQGMMAQEQTRQNYMNMMMNWILENKRIKAQRDAASGGFLSDLFAGGAQIATAAILA